MNEHDKILIAKYISGQASEEEIAMFKYLVNTSKVHEETYVEMYEAWQRSVYYNLDSIDAEKAYSTFIKDITKRSAPQARVISWYKIAIAASFLLICSLGIYYYRSSDLKKETHTAFKHNEISVPKGSTLRTVLPDGTKVWINAGSSLKYGDDFGLTSRTVYLVGEAYFDIAKGSVPFTVKTQHQTINDIGTVFNVKAYPEDFTFETTVIEGEVSIEGNMLIDSDKPQVVSVKKNQVFKLNYAPQKIRSAEQKDRSEVVEMKVQKISTAQVEEYTGWTEDLLVFEGKTFLEIVKIMERKYNVEIVLQDMELRNYEYSGSFKNVDEVEKALKILQETTDIDYNINGKVITMNDRLN
jgi:transmembrane sensor